jgi:Hemerythrin HHE cation binding domain
MTEMSMNKAIHGAFRRDLRRFTGALESFPAGDATRAARLGAAWTQLDGQFTVHHTGEHEIAWPAFKAVGVSPDLLAQLDTEHDAMAAALVETTAAFKGLEQSPRADQVATCLAAIRQLDTVVTQHLDHEEAELEPMLLAKQDAPEIKEMGRKFGKVGPAAGGQFFAWVTDGATPDELAAIKSQVPAPVITIIGGIFGRNYRKNIASVWAG